jgi:hypothetical protein
LRRTVVMATKTGFENELAPCGRTVSGERYRDRDDDGLLLDHMYYSCGCRSQLDEFHDGSVHRRIVHHKGTVVTDERYLGE